MIQLPDFSRSFEYENNYYWSSDVNRMAKVMAHYELYKQTIDVPGAIVECGVFKGASLIRLATFRQLLNNPAAKKIIGFDAFGPFPETEFADDKAWREKFISDSGDEGIDTEQLMTVLHHKGIGQNVDLVQGDVCQTIPSYLEKHPELRISLLNIDVDVYEPTKAVLEHLYDRVLPGGVIMLDDYANVFPGANAAVEEFFKDKSVEIKRFPYAVTPCYLVKK
ncbi:class I SAM-dependent methyltransferase [Spirosoma sp. BT702]|uniref:Class I SAM-dependent methyltransferase n=1 Tax=Spirosoma profusum TaxID=2771354 RepID=A0A926Y0L3_9BACT|nr:TylF/MycF/NovP-related O-methyltransferase [Spirosoma profusum]MBD2703681.1 class I SAM-dependent methyltransferase [Spirosoma profusum]